MKQHNWQQYDKQVDLNRAIAMDRVARHAAAYPHKDVDPFTGALADKLRQIFTASPDAYGHIPADEAAALLLAHWPR